MARVLAAIAVVVAGSTVIGADSTPPTKDSPRTEVTMGMFRLWFAKTDTDGDGFLDKAELAKAFRGSNAKPYDYVPPGKGDKDKNTAQGDETDPEKPDPAKDPKKSDYLKFPDYTFLIQLDQDMDGKISRDEFMAWARDVATQLRDQADAQQALVQAQLDLQKHANRPNSKAYKQAQAAVNQHQAQLTKLNTQLAKHDKHLATIKPPKK
jgi:hypothetical protein